MLLPSASEAAEQGPEVEPLESLTGQVPPQGYTDGGGPADEVAQAPAGPL